MKSFDDMWVRKREHFIESRGSSGTFPLSDNHQTLYESFTILPLINTIA